MKEFFKKHWSLVMWVIITIGLCWQNAANVTTRGFVYSVLAYAASIALWAVALLVFAAVASLAAKVWQKLFTRTLDVDEDDIAEDHDSVEWDAAQAWHSINLALGANHDDNDACYEISNLRAAGWHVEKQGNERGGFVYLKFIAPSGQS